MAGPADIVDERLSWEEVFRICKISLDDAYLTKKGGRMACPIHKGKNQQAFIWSAKRPAHCFSCNESWTKLGFTAAVMGIKKKDALKVLAEFANVPMRGEADPVAMAKAKRELARRTEQERAREAMERFHQNEFKRVQKKLSVVATEIKRCKELIEKSQIQDMGDEPVWTRLERLYEKRQKILLDCVHNELEAIEQEIDNYWWVILEAPIEHLEE